MVATILMGILYLLAFAGMLGLFALIGWWMRWALAVAYLTVPFSLVFWFVWSWCVAIPVGLLADGTALDKNVVSISHWLSGANWWLIKFMLCLPFNVFIWAADFAYWITH